MDKKIIEYQRRFKNITDLVVQEINKVKRYKATFKLHGKPKSVRFGQINAYTFLDGADQKKRNSYRARASKIKNNAGQYTYLIGGTANSLAYWLLW